MPQLGPPEIIIIILLVVLLFGAKRLPDAARSLGRSMRIFKSEVKEMSNDGKPQGELDSATQSVVEPPSLSERQQQNQPPAGGPTVS